MTPALPGPKSSVTQLEREMMAELVMKLVPPQEVLGRYQFTLEKLRKRSRDPQFAAALLETKRSWDSGQNVSQRVRTQAAFLLEDTMVEYAAAVKGEGVPLGVRRDAVETLAKISDNWEPGKHKKDQAQQGSQFKVVINLGPRPEDQRVISANVIDSTAKEISNGS